MTIGDREARLMNNFVNLLPDHVRDFDGFVRDVENVRYCHTPIDDQQIARVEYALRNMEIRMLTLKNCIEQGGYQGQPIYDALVNTKNDWISTKKKVDSYLTDIRDIVENASASLRHVRGVSL